MENSNLIIPGLSLTVIISVIFSLHGIVQQQIKNLQERLEAESLRAKENIEKAEKRIDDLSTKAEQRLKEETGNVESRRQEYAKFLEEKNTLQLTQLRELLQQDKKKKGC